MKELSLRGILALLFFWVGAHPQLARAQQSEDPIENARLQFGPFGLTPSIGLTNFGIDSNVFNEVEDPKRDFTFTLSPQIDSWFRAGRSRTMGSVRSDLVYFHEYSSERSIDGVIDGRFEVPGNRLTPWLSGGLSSTRQRVGYEIDLRSRRTTKDVAIGMETRIAGKTGLAFSAQRTDYDYDADATFLGSSLQETLNRRSESVALEYQQSLTPLTTFIVRAEAVRDRFSFSPTRDADSVRVQTGLDLDDDALISGAIRLGYRKLDAVGGGIAPFRGFTASFFAASTVKGRTRLELAGERDVVYSFEFAYPYYLLTGATLTATPRLTDRWEVQARIGGQRLAYQAAGTIEGPAGRIDRFVLFGGGIGYRISPTFGIRLNIDRERRKSPQQLRDYEGFRIGASVTYGR